MLKFYLNYKRSGIEPNVCCITSSFLCINLTGTNRSMLLRHIRDSDSGCYDVTFPLGSEEAKVNPFITLMTLYKVETLWSTCRNGRFEGFLFSFGCTSTSTYCYTLCLSFCSVSFSVPASSPPSTTPGPTTTDLPPRRNPGRDTTTTHCQHVTQLCLSVSLLCSCTALHLGRTRLIWAAATNVIQWHSSLVRPRANGSRMRFQNEVPLCLHFQWAFGYKNHELS
jgi:hypothetical protein